MKRMVQKKMLGGRAPVLALGIMIVLFLLVGCAAAAQPAGTESYHGKEVAASQVLVKFHTATPELIQNVKIKEDADKAEAVGSTGAMVFHSRSRNVATLISELSARPDVEYAEPDYIVHAVDTIPNDPSYGSLWGMTKISAPSAWDRSTGSPANIAAVIDTGIDYTHPDLAANVWSAPAEYTVTIAGKSITCPAGSHGFNAITNTCDPADDNGHGTHVSGTIGAVGNNGVGVAGVNWNTRIIGAKFLDSKGSGTTSNAVNAIDFVIQTRNRFGSDANVRVLSNSWGGGGSDSTLLNEINKANTNGMLFVAAAGNSGTNNDAIPFYPANYNAPNVVSVAATDSSDTLASFSEYGQTTVDLAAPGVGIWSTLPGNSYASWSGTSMATPHVSGAALLILSECSLDTAQLKATILNNVDPVASLSSKTVTGGRLNVNKAIIDCSAPKTSTTTALGALPASSSYGSPVTFTATVSPAAATGTVTFYDGSSSLGTATLSSGTAGFTTSALAAGTHSITATYGGNSAFATSTSTPLSYAVTKAASATSLTSSLNPSNSGQAVTFTATVSPITATGTVTFSDGTTTLGSATLSSGKASYSTSGLSAGTHSITATYNGNSNYLTSNAAVSQVVNAATPDFSLSASPASRSVNAGSGTTYTIAITRSGGFTGPVTLSIPSLPAGVSGTFNPVTTTGTSSKLTITTSSATLGGTYPLTITGTSSSTPGHTTKVTLIVKARKVR